REDFQENLRQAISDVLGVDLKVEAIVDPGAQGGSASGGRPANPGPNANPNLGAGQSPGGGAAPANNPGDNAGRPGTTANASEGGHAASAQPANPASSARAAVRAKVKGPQEQRRRQTDGDDHGADPGDQDLDESGLSGRELVERTLGATVIEEIDHN